MENVASAPEEVAAQADALCPRCSKSLVDPRGLGWCQACGYCRSLEEDRARMPLGKPVAKDSAAPKLPGMDDVKRSEWPIVLVSGAMLIAAVCFMASRHYAPSPLQRAAWTTIQLAAGVLMVLASQCHALILLAPKDEGLNFIDALVPFRLYSLVFNNLPRMRLNVWLSSWGMTLLLTALIWVGGLEHWLKLIPKSAESQLRQ